MIRTRLTERFGIQHPVICAPMAYVTGGALAAAVSRAGGLGIVGGGYAGTVGGEPDLETELAQCANDVDEGAVILAILRVPLLWRSQSVYLTQPTLSEMRCNDNHHAIQLTRLPPNS